MLSQSETAKLLDQCANEESPELALEEVLSAYVAWKLIRGQSCEMVLQKLRYMSIYLRVSGRRWVLETGSDILMALATELSFGGGLIGACPVSTPLGKTVWNGLRRRLGSSSHAYVFSTDPEYGGPITFHERRSVDAPRNPVRLLEEPNPTPAFRNGANTTHTTTIIGGLGHSTGHTETAISSNATASTSTSTSTSTQHDTSQPNTTTPSAPSTSSSTSLLSFFSRRRLLSPTLLSSAAQPGPHWAERPRFLRMWFLTRPHLAGRSTMMDMLVPDYASLVPAYTSFRGTLPLYSHRHLVTDVERDRDRDRDRDSHRESQIGLS